MLQDTERIELLREIYRLLDKYNLPITTRFLRDLDALFKLNPEDPKFIAERGRHSVGY